MLAAKRVQKRGSILRYISEVIHVIQRRHRAQHKIVPCQPRDLAWITSESMGNEVLSSESPFTSVSVRRRCAAQGYATAQRTPCRRANRMATT